MKIAAFLLPVALLPVSTVCAQECDSIFTHIDVRIEGMPEVKTALLMESGGDFRFDIISEAKFVDGHCSFDYVSDCQREMEILFDDELRKGCWLTKKFYAEGDTVDCFTDSASVCISSRGELQRMKDRQKEELDSATGGMAAHYYEVVEACWAAEDTESMTYRDSYDKLMAIWNRQDTLRWDYIIAGMPSLFGLFEIRGELQAESPYKNVDQAMERIERAFTRRYGNFAWHPYYDECKQMFQTRLLKPGRK